MSISLKLILYKGKTYSDGRHPIMLQYISNRKVKRKVLYKCFENEWDEKSCRVKSKVPNSAYTNNFISEQFAAAEQDLFGIKSGVITPEQLFTKRESMTLDEAFHNEMARLKTDMKVGSYNKVNGFKTQISEYTDIKSLLVANMDIAWFHKYASYLKSIGNIGATAQKKIKTVRAIVKRYSSANISEDLKTFKVQVKKSIKQKLTPAEFLDLENLDLPEGELITAARDIFLMQVYLRGARIGDILQATSDQIKNGFFTYTDDKTGKTISIKIIPRAQALFDHYLGKHEKIFPFFKWKLNKNLSDFENKKARMKEKETCTSVVNRFLKIIARMLGLDKPLSSHVARHTFARMAIDKINNPMITMELLGHSSLAVHQVYLNDIRKDQVLDQAADDIFS